MNLTVQNVQVYLTDRGSGGPTLFLHGVPDSADMWDGIIQRLETKYRCIAPDLPGLGRSIAPADFSFSLDNMAQFIDSLVQALGITEPLNLVITDWGGPYGLSWAIKNPTKVRRIALVGSTIFFSDYHWHPLARIWRTPILGEVMMATLTEPGFAFTMRRSAPSLTREQVRKTHKLSFGNPAVKRTILRLYRTGNPKNFVGWEDQLLTLTKEVPMWVLWGDKDSFIPGKYAYRFGAQNIIHFPDHGHWVAIEAADKVAEQLLTFFA